MRKRKLVLVSLGGNAGGFKNAALIKRVIILGLIAVIACVMTIILWSQSGYAVTVNGEVVGTVKNEEEVTAIIEHVEEDVSTILGYDYEITTEVELTGTIGSEEDHITEAFMRSVEEIDMLYILAVDGASVAVARTELELRNAVEEVSVKYAVGSDSTVSFDNVITITHDYAPVSAVVETADVVKLLDPEYGGEHALTVRTVFSETHQETVAFDYEYQENDELYEGTRAVLVVGVDGTADVTERVEYINGSETSRVETSNIVVQPPVTEVVSVGTLFRPEWVSYGEYIWPCGGWISSDYGHRDVEIGTTFHRGLDIAHYIGAEIYAADGGTVIFSGESGNYGLMVEIEHDNGEITRYAHCHSLAVSAGDKVARGQVIGYMGDTGNVSGVHLHFEIRVDGEAIDPLTRLPQ